MSFVLSLLLKENPLPPQYLVWIFEAIRGLVVLLLFAVKFQFSYSPFQNNTVYFFIYTHFYNDKAVAKMIELIEKTEN